MSSEGKYRVQKSGSEILVRSVWALFCLGLTFTCSAGKAEFSSISILVFYVSLYPLELLLAVLIQQLIDDETVKA